MDVILVKQEQVQPLLKWAGNKFGTPVAERVKALYAPYRDTHHWVEPFIGGGGMLLSVRPQAALCLDLCDEIIGLHRWIGGGGQYSLKECVCDPVDCYYQRRLEFRGLQSQYGASVDFVDHDQFFSLMYWLNKAGFNGLWRVNGNGEYNVPAGRTAAGALYNPPPPDMDALRRGYSPDWTFIQGDFEVSGAYETPQGRFIYCDPPYFGTHSQYTARSFTWDDHKRLAQWLSGQPGPVVASNSSHPDIVNLYADLGFQIEFIEVSRSISCRGNERKPAVELLAMRGFGDCRW